jgi:RNA polymerase sigma-70 factor (ECF subfamily)
MAGPAKDPSSLLPAARAGSMEALGLALDQFRRYLLQIAERELDPELRAKGGASDLVQLTFLEAQRNFTKFHGDSGPELRAWLRRLLVDNLANYERQYRGTAKRRLAREVALDPGGSSTSPERAVYANTPSPSEEVMAHERAQTLQRALDQLPEDYRRVITLRHYEQFSFEEIGEVMERSPEAARKLCSRAIERLRQELGTPP